jgi:hypothetical protein
MNGQSYNRYSYVMNNPTNLTDPTGFAATNGDIIVRVPNENSICEGRACGDVVRDAQRRQSQEPQQRGTSPKMGGYTAAQLRQNAQILRQSVENPQGNFLERLFARIGAAETLSVAEYYDAWANSIESPSEENTAALVFAAFGVAGSGDPRTSGAGASAAPAFSHLIKQSAKKSDSGKNVHGNDKSSTKPQHRYEINDKHTINPQTMKPDTVKTGVSGGELNQDESSRRANSQVNKLNRDAGTNRYEAVVPEKNVPSRAEILKREQQATNQLARDGNSLSRQVRPKPE